MIKLPFISHHNKTFYDKIKIIFFTLSGIAIIRFILTILLTILTSFFLYIFLIGYKPKDELGNYQNFSKFRRLLLFIPQILGRITLFILGYYWIEENITDFFKLNYFDNENMSKLIICNHVSFIDTIYLLTRGLPNAVVGANTINLPIVGNTIKKFASVLVPNNEEQKKMLPDTISQINDRLTHISIQNLNRPLVIFPEGATKNGNYLLKFQKGAFLNKITYQPILLNYKYKYFDPSWTLNSGTFELIYYMCCQFFNKLEVIYLEPTNMSSDEIRNQYIGKLGLINSNFSNYDNRFLKKNYDKIDYINKYVFFDNLFTTETYNKLTGLNYEKISEELTHFFLLDKEKEGTIEIDDKKYNFFEYIKKITPISNIC